jgi:hypothetical protein
VATWNTNLVEPMIKSVNGKPSIWNILTKVNNGLQRNFELLITKIVWSSFKSKKVLITNKQMKGVQIKLNC